ncbi:MAG TPA: glycosyltransferase [Anaerolineae bacterium]|nr:glycosyltransferase [Anaerolineae bacterium]
MVESLLILSAAASWANGKQVRRNMRVVMLSKAIVVGAYQRKLEELACLPGMELIAIAPPSWRDSRGEVQLERVYTEGYRLLELPVALNGHFHAHFYPALPRTLQRLQPDLIHVDEEPYNLASWQAFRWAAAHRCPALFFSWQNLLRQYPPPFSWIERTNYSRAAYAIVGNKEGGQVLRAKGYSGPMSVLPQFGVDPDLYQPGVAPLLERPPGARLVVGYAGGLVPEKGVDLLLRAVWQCNQRLAAEGASGCHLVIAGTGPEQVALEDLARRLEIVEQVTFLGKISSIAMPAVYASMDVLALPSRTTETWKEQFGRVLIEAMACRVPVVGSDSGEIPNVIADAGLVFPEYDPAALADLLIALAQQPVLREHLAQRGYERAITHFTQARIAKQTYAVYQQVLQSAGS